MEKNKRYCLLTVELSFCVFKMDVNPSTDEPEMTTKITRNNRAKNPINLRPCEVCGAKASGFHFGAITCEACKVCVLGSIFIDCVGHV